MSERDPVLDGAWSHVTRDAVARIYGIPVVVQNDLRDAFLAMRVPRVEEQMDELLRDYPDVAFTFQAVAPLDLTWRMRNAFVLGFHTPLLITGISDGLWSPPPTRWQRVKRAICRWALANWRRAGEDVREWEGRTYSWRMLLPPRGPR